jgi:hypothetical protein
MPTIVVTVHSPATGCCPIVDDSEKKYRGARIQRAALGDLNEMIGGFL